MRLLSRFLLWRARRRHLAHRKWLRKNRVVLPKPDGACIVRNWREPN